MGASSALGPAAGSWVASGGGEPDREEACWEVPAGAPCVLPFVLEGRVVADCAADPDGGTWCPYDLDTWSESAGAGGWGYCQPPPLGDGPESLLDRYARTGHSPRNASEPLPPGLGAGGAEFSSPAEDPLGGATAQEAIDWDVGTPSESVSRAPSELSPGAVAGIAIACVALLGVLVGLITIRRVRPKLSRRGSSSPRDAGETPKELVRRDALDFLETGGERGEFWSRSTSGDGSEGRSGAGGGGVNGSQTSPVWPHASPDPLSPSEIYPSGSEACYDSDLPTPGSEAPPPSRSSTFSEPSQDSLLPTSLDSPLQAVMKAAAGKAAARAAASPLPPGTPVRNSPRSWDRWVAPDDRV